MNKQDLRVSANNLESIVLQSEHFLSRTQSFSLHLALRLFRERGARWQKAPVCRQEHRSIAQNSPRRKCLAKWLPVLRCGHLLFAFVSRLFLLDSSGLLMFTGLIEEIGVCLDLRRRADEIQLSLTAPGIASHVKVGDSVAVNGCCLTVVHSTRDHLHFDLLDETLQRTNLGELSEGSAVNLERALPADGRIGGHFVQGHVDCTAGLIARDILARDLRLEFELPTHFSQYVAWKGSICVNGVSLTVADLTESSFSVYLIAHTRKATNLEKLSRGGRANLEFDILAKYAERIMTRVSR
jgi:riboflavin synthase